MKKLPVIHPTQLAQAQQAKLARWLSEWRLAQRLGEEPSEPVAAPAPESPMTILPCPGALVLLAPTHPAFAARPRYLALLPLEPDQLLAVPFSRFSSPALPGELELGGACIFTRVLCVWNARRMDTRELPQAWPTGALTPGEQADCRALYQAVTQHTPCPPALLDRIGPPLLHPADPRYDYREEEQIWMDAVAPRESPARHLYDRADTPTQLPRAAEDREPYGGK